MGSLVSKYLAVEYHVKISPASLTDLDGNAFRNPSVLVTFYPLNTQWL